MLYQEYKAKLDKRKHAFERLWKFRLLILAAVILLVAASGALLGVKGIVYDFSIPISTLQYGQSFSAFADCVFGEASFEFRAEGEQQWTTQCPIYAGKYECRAVGKTSVGTMRPGEIRTFEILPISVDVTVYGKDPGDQPPKYYGDELVFYAQLPYGDELQVKNYTYERQEDEIVVSIDKADVVAVNSDGEDVTSSYAFDSQTLPVEQRPITVTMPSQTFEYDGQPHQTQGAEADEGLLPKHHLEVVAADSFTEAGNYTNTFGTLKIVDDKGNDMTSMYDVTRHDGKVNVAKREISVTTGSLPITYDGASHNAASFEITSEKQLAAGQTLQLTYDSFTSAGRYTNEPATVKVATEDGTDVTSNYTVKWKYGTVDIAKRPLTIDPVGDSWGWVYDAQPHLDDGSFQVVYDSAYPQLDGQEVHFNYTSPVNAGNYTAHRREAGQESATGEFAFSVTITLDGKDETANFDITDNVSEKTFTVQRRHVEVQLGSITEEYDGTFYQNNSVTFANDTQMVSGQSLSVECKQYRDANEYQNELESSTSYTIQTAEGEVVDPANYEIKWLPGAVTISKRPITVKTESDEFEYDGTPHQTPNDEFEVTATQQSLVEGHDLAVFFQNWTEASDEPHDNMPQSWNITANGVDVTNNYQIKWECGTVTINKRRVIVQFVSSSTEYDGAFHQYNSFTFAIGAEVASGQTLSVTCKQYKDADEYPNELESDTSYEIKAADGQVVSPANYDIEWVEGTVTITKRPITVTTDSGTHEYDGEAFSVPTATVQNLVSGHTYQLTPTSSTVPTFTNATQATENRFEFTLDVYDGEENVTKNYYNASTSYGTIEVTPRDVVLTVGSGSFVYNAEPQSVKKITGDRLLDGHRVEAEYPSFTYANTYRNDITGECRIFAGEIDVTENYNIQSIQTGTVEITKRPLTIQPVGDSWGWVYDAQTHLSDSNFQVIYDSQYPQLDNQEVHFNYTSPVNAGDYTTYMHAVGQEGVTDELAFSVEVKITIKGIDVTNNFEIDDNVSQKTFTIQKRPIEVQTGTKAFTYNGVPQQYAQFEVTSAQQNLVEEQILNVNFNAWTDANTYDNMPLSWNITAKDGDVTGNYDISWEYGTVTIDPYSISVATKDLEYFYIGKPIYPSILSSIEDIVYCTKGQLQNQDRFSLSYESDIVNVGNKYQNKPTIAIVNSDGDDKTNNYTIQNPDTWGTITVKQRIVDAHVYDIPLEYNGMYQGYMSVVPTTYNSTEEGSGIVAGQVLVVHNSAQLKDCGSIKLELTWSVTTVNGVDASDNYHVNLIYEGEGVLKITKRYIRFLTESDNKLYDGKPLSNKGLTAERLVEGHQIEYKLTSELPSLTNVGQIDNEFAFTATITDENGVTVTDNYDVESAYNDVTYGKLTVSERAVTLKTASATLTYDAQPHTFDTIEGELASGHSVKATFYSFTDAKTYFNLPEDGWKIVDDEGNVIYDSANGASTNYIITWEYGTVTIDPRPITVATGSEMGIEYDGKPHSVESYTVQSENFLETYGHTLVVTYYYSFEDAFEHQNYLYDGSWYIEDGSHTDVTSNYEVTWEWGTVEIVPRKITVKTADVTQVYDGTMYPKNDSSTPLPKVVSQTQLVEEQTLSVEYKRYKVVGNYKTEPSSYSITKSDGTIVTYNYDVVWDYGTTTINKCPITVKLKDDVQLAWTYDAQCHVTSDSFVVDSSTPLPANHTLYVTVKSFTNAGEYKAGEGDFEYQIDITFHGLSRPTIVSNFEITDEVKGTEVTISKRHATITTGSATWVYYGYSMADGCYSEERSDGDSNRGLLPNQWFYVLDYTLVDGITDSDTEVKYVDNEFTKWEIRDADGSDVSDSYELEWVWGKLRVKSPIVVRVYSFKKTYDGKEISLTAENYRIEKLPPDIKESDVTLNLGYSMTRVGTVTLADFKQYNFEKENYHATCEDGIWDLSFYGQDNLIEITPRRITVRSDTRSVQWTGGALYGRDYGYTFSTLAEGDSIDFVDITGVLLPDELEAVNTIGAISIVNAKGENVTDCYQIDIKEGTLRWRNPPQNEQFALSNLVLTEQADPFSRKFGEN